MSKHMNAAGHEQTAVLAELVKLSFSVKLTAHEHVKNKL